MVQIPELNQDQFQSAVIQSNKPVLVEFFAPWCGPCKSMSPIVEDLAWIFSGELDVYRVNVDTETGLAERFRALAVPTFVFFQSGREKCRIPGTASKRMLSSYVWRLVVKD